MDIPAAVCRSRALTGGADGLVEREQKAGRTTGFGSPSTT